MRRFLPNQDKIKLIKRVLAGGEPIAVISREFGVSRKSIYHWVNLYKNSPNRCKSISIQPKYKKTSSGITNVLLRIVVANPKLSIRDYFKILEKKGEKTCPSTIYSILKKLSIETVGRRENFAKSYAGPGRLTKELKTEVVNQVLIFDKKIAAVSRDYQISRKVIYKWISDFKNGGLAEKYLKGESHPKYIKGFEGKLLSCVKNDPSLGVRDLAKATNISNYLSWRTLRDNNLGKLWQRQLYSGKSRQFEDGEPSFIYSQEVPDSALNEITPNLLPAPPPSKFKIFKSFSFFTIFTLAILFGSTFLYEFVYSEANEPLEFVGLTFAAIALIMGSFFLLYSMKYYFTLAIVLSYQNRKDKIGGNLISKILGTMNEKMEEDKDNAIGLMPDLSGVFLKTKPYISVQIPFYNEKNVVRRSIEAATSFKYPEYEVILCDDSTDETTQIIRDYQTDCLFKGEKLNEIKNEKEGWTLSWVEVRPGVTLKHLHRTTRDGFKGGALALALKICNPKTEYVSVFDADFVPYPDSLELFLKYFQVSNENCKLEIENSAVAAVQGYQWHVLNKSENWITRGVRSEYAGSYVIERSGEEIYGGLKQISGSVYMIKRKVLETVGWGRSITEDFELTLKLYEKGYKVLYTPYIQAPAECVSVLSRLIRQRMRWAEGHSFNVKKMFVKLMGSPKVTLTEKLEFMYLTPYYLQAFLFLVGTFAWLVSEAVFRVKLPFWTEIWGWSLVLTNMVSLPLLNSIGLFVEEGDKKDYVGIGSFILLSYLLVPFQAYASLKGFIEKEEGPWFRTPKTGKITDIFAKGKFFRFIREFIPTGVQNETSPYLALTTAANNFSNFKISRKESKWIGKAALAILLIISNLIISIAPGVPYFIKPEEAYAQSFGMIDGDDGDSGDIDFENGVLSLNTDKSVYSQGETAYLQMAVLDKNGNTICDGDITLNVYRPDQSIDIYSTKNQKIQKSDTCSPDNNVTNNPDYFVKYKIGEVGTYKYDLTNNANGYQIRGSFEVKEQSDLIIKRVSATRINPFKSSYKMQIILSANTDISGEVVETIPKDFIVDGPSTWNINLKKGQTKTFEYTYQAPKISPEFYTLGPLIINGTQTNSLWQIASDAISLVQSKTFADPYPTTNKNTCSVTLTSPATAGNLLISGIAIDKASGTITKPTNFTLVQKGEGGVSSGGMAYMIAAGGETTVTWSYANNEECSTWIGEYSGLAASNVLDVSTENEADLSTAVNSISTGTTGTTAQNDELGVAMFMSDSGNSVGSSRSWTNSFSTIAEITSTSGSPFLNVATKTLTSTGTVQSTLSHNGSDECYATVATFKTAAVTQTTISSGANQTFTINDSATAISTITITDASTPTITAANDIYVIIPSTFNMTLDTSDTSATFGGTASGKVSSTVTYEDYLGNANSKILKIAVSSDFAAGDTLTVSGLSFTNFSAASTADNLELDTNKNGTADVVDDKTITVNNIAKSFQNGVYPTAGYAGNLDTGILQQSATTNFGAGTSISIDGDDPASSGQDNWGIFKWDVSDVPVGSQVQSATITINIVNPGAAYTLYEMKRNWTEGGATWNTYDGASNWGTAGGQGTNDRGTTSFGTTPTSVTGLQTITLNAAGVAKVQEWINNSSTNYGLIVGDSALTDGLDLDSSEAATATNRPKLTIEYASVVNSSSSSATGNSFQRKTWNDGSLYWKSFYTGSEIQFWYSDDGTTWAENTYATITVSTSDFSIEADSNNVYISYINGYDIEVRKGSSYPGSSFSWSGASIVFDGTGSSDSYQYSSISQSYQSGNPNFVWVMARYYNGTNYYIKAVPSVNPYDISSWSIATNLSSTSNTDSNVYGAFATLTSGVTYQIYAVWIRGTTIEGAYNNGDTWDATDSIGTGKSGLSSNISVSSDTGGNFHLVWIDGSNYVQYKKYTSGAWDSVATRLDSSATNTNVTITVDTNSNDIYAMYIRSGTVYYNKYSGSWSGEGDANISEGTSPGGLTSNYRGAGAVFTEWTSGSGSQYTVNWAIIAVPENLWFFFSLGLIVPAWIKRRRSRIKYAAEKHI